MKGEAVCVLWDEGGCVCVCVCVCVVNLLFALRFNSVDFVFFSEIFFK